MEHRSRFEISYKPQGPVAEAYLQCREQRAFIMGPLGSGKTNASCWKAFRIVCDQQPDSQGVRRTRLAFIRNTYSDLLSTTAKDWLEMFEPLGRFVQGSREPPTHHLDFTLPPQRIGDKPTRVQAEIIFLALDREEHVKKLRGLQLTAAMLSEVKELPFAIVQMVDLRVGRYPQGEVGPTWHGIFGDTNAPDTDHWYYKLAEEKRPEGWAFFRQPGGLIRDSADAPWRTNPDAENLRNLPLGYYLKGAQGKDDDWVRVNLANEYGFVRDGKPVYPDYRDSVMCRPFELVRALGLYIGLDFGLTPAALFGQPTTSGQWRFRRELVTEDTGIVRFARELRRFTNEHFAEWTVHGIYGDPAGGQRQAGDVDERTAFQLLAAEGIQATPAPGNNDFVLRAEAFAAPMKRMIDGEPGMLIHPDCQVTRKGLQGGYAYRRVRVAGEERYRDLPDKNKWSHPCFVAGTPISTPRGVVPIEVLRIGDLVNTPVGPRRVVANMSREVPALVDVEITTGTALRCTPDHPFAAPEGHFVPAAALQYMQPLVTEGTLWVGLPNTPSKSSTASATTSSPRATSRRTTGSAASISTAPCGSTRTAQSRTDSTSTTRTGTRPTAGSTTLSCRASLSMAVCMGWSATRQSFVRCLRRLGHSLLRRTARWPEARPQPIAAGAACSPGPWSASPAFSAGVPTRSAPDRCAVASAAKPVNRLRDGHQASTTRAASASNASFASSSTSTRRSDSAAAVARVSPAGSGIVFNLEVEQAHCYYAGGVLVSNCEAGQYLVLGAGEGSRMLDIGNHSSKDIAAFRRRMGYPT
ncbi:hypothetical protein ISF6_3236 [Piscinibacter sakaiensis]|uniref:Hint domain-containing protein n=1 Tax=Piscinibacter sakaiensis TaxID=1547922 RepID=A0A0K8P448_PISS1|nr:Hint domain-containing protein [Piscinibacter sakaiensis]GAP37381.1 hypothetical protein ISF6_3236 [Piscinibacter sakaiensis]